MKLFLIAVLAVSSAVAQYYQGGGGGQRGYPSNVPYDAQPQEQDGQYTGGAQYTSQYDTSSTKKAPAVFPAILSHKQALGADGSFNYAFSADNGLQQGETISPDGTRKGSYSYVDPNGKTISVKYEAGKDGFRILGDDKQQQQQQQPGPVSGSSTPYNVNQYTGGFPVQRQQYNAVPAQQQFRGNYQQISPSPLPTNQGISYGNLGGYQQEGAGRGPAVFPQLPGYFSQLPGGQATRSTAPVQAYPGPAKAYPAPAKAYPAPVKAYTSPVKQTAEREDYEEDPNQPHSFGTGYAFEFQG